MKLYDYQKELARKGELILLKYKILYLALQMRVGKTIISLEIAKRCKAKSVLFITPKKAITTIERDYSLGNYKDYFNITIINYESIHKLTIKNFDIVICDEAHKLGSYPKPSKKTKQLKDLLDNNRAYLILLSGTPTPESYSQIYHQLWISPHSPFAQWPTFYKWASSGFILVTQKRISGYIINDYSKANKKHIDLYTNKLFLTYTQKQAGFLSDHLDDKIIKVKIDKNIYKLVDYLIKHRFYEFKDGSIISCDTAVSLQNKIHQIFSGTVIVEKDLKFYTKILDQSKINFILNNYKNKKIAIFYLYRAEGELLMNKLKWTSDPFIFNNSGTDVVFISQFQSGARSINLSAAEVIIFYNIHFSSELYQQARQRGQDKNKIKTTELHWLMSEDGIEEKIYRRVINKQSYTISYFKEDFYDRKTSSN